VSVNRTPWTAVKICAGHYGSGVGLHAPLAWPSARDSGRDSKWRSGSEECWQLSAIRQGSRTSCLALHDTVHNSRRVCLLAVQAIPSTHCLTAQLHRACPPESSDAAWFGTTFWPTPRPSPQRALDARRGLITATLPVPLLSCLACRPPPCDNWQPSARLPQADSLPASAVPPTATAISVRMLPVSALVVPPVV
jgi:hypothetical protein